MNAPDKERGDSPGQQPPLRGVAAPMMAARRCHGGEGAATATVGASSISSNEERHHVDRACQGTVQSAEKGVQCVLDTRAVYDANYKEHRKRMRALARVKDIFLGKL
ncbi:hypothetical protein HPB52_022818 [Rhipicephalus sanguineus]|uniref:Uncharacterized protein n=1 Tax=Rhipicephalus sanguineus TaxID=34632 RepID=A0A9D4T824_RHISA|nr:hypothetical protein HPB52_022818 [Rhipicephalus sanguineus]